MSPRPDEGDGRETAHASPADSWRLDIDESALLRRLAYAFPCLLGGVAVLALALVGWLVADALWTGHTARALGVAMVAILGLLIQRYVPALLATAVGETLRERYAPRWLAVGSVLSAAVLLGSARLHPGAPIALFVASWVPTVVAAHFPTAGHADPETGTLVVDGTEIPLGAVRGHRTITVGPFAVCWLSYRRGAPTAPRLVVVPADRASMVADLVDRPASSAADEREPLRPLERLIVLAFGLGLLAIGPVLWIVLPPGDGRLIALYAGVMFGLFGGLVVWYGYTS
ncbi:hypothetical protein [Haloplanus halobius]|uniref:hypothetical protein n=1 Tax=Haloplanus halobius TaxID=2934938 RepID=UPI00200C0358|nr:hypothetical protein [Haloplanus sp. XH21]